MRFFLVLCALPVLLSAEQSNPDKSLVKNLHRVDENLYRSGQPQAPGMRELERKGIKTIINLRDKVNDKQELKGTSLHSVHIKCRAKKVDYATIVLTMKAIKNAEKPVLIHCRRGSDRTGCMVAAYRIVFQKWSKEQALAELLDEQYGYLEGLFPVILEQIEQLDEAQLREEVFAD